MFIDTFRSNFYVNLVAWGLLLYTEWCVIMGSYRCNNACQLNEYIVLKVCKVIIWRAWAGTWAEMLQSS